MTCSSSGFCLALRPAHSHSSLMDHDGNILFTHLASFQSNFLSMDFNNGTDNSVSEGNFPVFVYDMSACTNNPVRLPFPTQHSKASRNLHVFRDTSQTLLRANVLDFSPFCQGHTENQCLQWSSLSAPENISRNHSGRKRPLRFTPNPCPQEPHPHDF